MLTQLVVVFGGGVWAVTPLMDATNKNEMMWPIGLQDADPGAQYCCDSTQWVKHTRAWWPQEAVAGCDVCLSHIQTQTLDSLLQPTKITQHTRRRMGAMNTRSGPKKSADREMSVTWRGEGEEGAALPPAARRFGLQHPHPRTTTPRPEKHQERKGFK